MADYFGADGKVAKFFTDTLGVSSKNAAGAIGAVGGAVTDFFAANASAQQANQYFAEREEQITRADIARQQTALQEYSAQRKIANVTGAQEAATGAAGFQLGGTSADLMRESVQQGFLTQAVIGEQGAVSEAGFLDAAKAAEAEGAAAKGGVFGNILGGVMKLGSAALMLA